jgi:hypothetical protein
MKIKIICKKCNSSVAETLEKGVKPTASMYSHLAIIFGWLETKTGYLCNYCLQAQNKQEKINE